MAEALEFRVPAYTPLQIAFLARLLRLLETKAEFNTDGTADPFMYKIVERGVFAFFRECEDVGVRIEAMQLLETFLAGIEQRISQRGKGGV